MEFLKTVALGYLVADKTAISDYISFYLKNLKGPLLTSGSNLGQYPDIGKKARDLLYAYYNRGLKVSFHDDLLSVTLTKQHSRRPVLGCVALQKSLNSSSFALSIDTNDVFLIAPGFTSGLTSVLNVNISDQNSIKINLHYLRDFVSLSTNIGIFSNPIFGVSGLFGNDTWAIGTDVALNTNTRKFTTINGGFRMTWDDKTASLTLEEMGRLVKGQYYHPFSNFAIGAEWCFKVAKRRSTFAFGGQRHFGPTDVKGRVNNEGIAGVLQRTWSTGSFFRLSVEKRFNNPRPIIGVAVAYKA